MSHQADFADYCLELLSQQGSARSRRMFGAHGLYIDDLFVGIASGETLYLKADAQTRARFEQAGCREFTYSAKGRQVELGFWSAPVDAMDSPALMRPWAQLAVAAALRARKSPAG